jgi:hypothetical protein
MAQMAQRQRTGRKIVARHRFPQQRIARPRQVGRHAAPIRATAHHQDRQAFLAQAGQREAAVRSSKISTIDVQITRFSMLAGAGIMTSSYREQGDSRRMPATADRFEQLDHPITKGAHDVERP